ncbi:MAG: hypothetical protein H6744_02330 [Deltaproteobacteria bacterium]|nr:hypothetical protein [Deltaproteobacteria bacterium]MCB9785508.1 hypothetical protein [Deltaproteobacteria bacterium]
MPAAPGARSGGRWRLGLLVALGVLGAMGLRTAVSGSQARRLGMEQLAAGEELGATMALREAVSWYLPLAWWREDAIEALWSLHERQVAAGRLPEAVRTLNALRGGLFAARSLVHPDGDWLARVDGALAPLLARWEAEAASTQGRAAPGTLEDRQAWFAATLARPTRPSRAFGLLAVLGFLGWVAATWRGLGREGRERWRWLGAGALGFTAFLLGVALA